MGSLRQAVLQGQYQYEKGVYFRGKALEPSVAAIPPPNSTDSPNL